MEIMATVKRTQLIVMVVVQLLFFPLAISGGAISAQETTDTNSTLESSSNSQTEQSQESGTSESVQEQTNTSQNQVADTSTTTNTQPPPLTEELAPILPYGPRGADASTFTYNTSTGLYENDLYTYNPETQQRTAKRVPDVRYNYQTNKWEKLGWRFSAPLQDYVPYVVFSSDSRPAGILIGVAPNSSQQQSLISNNGQQNGTSVSNTGPGSNTNVSNSNNNNGLFNYNNSTDIGITLSLVAQSGAASVLNNTTGGNAATGNANSTANVLNKVQSNWNTNDILMFNSDLYGDLYGDLYVDTSNLGPNSNLSVNNDNNNNLEINVSNDIDIENNIDLIARSGDATVSGNTTGGNATSGNANAMANILNLIDTSVGTRQSFIGNLNIYGTLDGDILFPKGTLETIISETGPGSNVDINDTLNNDVVLNSNKNVNINDNVTAVASSGDATVSRNTTGGDATSGDATTSVNIINLTGREVVSENTLLVFINVHGEWIGLMMDRPGVRAAAIGGNVTVNNETNNNVVVNEDTDVNITNNVNVTATSGDATVPGNTTGGNATSGDANAAVNLANLVGSDITATSWYGILFINIFGTWSGSFGIDTEAGDRPMSIGGEGSGSNGVENNSQSPQKNVASTSNTQDKPIAFVLSSNQDGSTSARRVNDIGTTGFTTSTNVQSTSNSVADTTDQNVLGAEVVADTGITSDIADEVSNGSSAVTTLLIAGGLVFAITAGRRLLVSVAAS